MLFNLSNAEIYGLAGFLGPATHCTFRVYEPGDPVVALKILILAPTVALVLVRHPASWTFILPLRFLFTYGLCTILSVLAYRLSPFHPLTSYPGPILFKLSKIPGMWYSWTGKQHHVLKAMHDQYGTVVRTGPNEVSIIEEEAVPLVFGASGLQKGQYYLARKDPNAPGNLIVLTGESHANRRRLWNRGMGSEAMKDYDLIIHRRAEQLVDKLEGLTGRVVDLAAWFGYYAFDFMGDMCFGGGYEMLHDAADTSDHWGVLERFITTAGVISHVPWASQTIQKIPFLKKDLVKMRSYAVQVASKRYADGSRTKDLWYHLSDEAGHEKAKPAFRDVIADGALAIVAGTDTTASALTTLMYFLCRYPECYRKVQEEVDMVFPRSADTMDATKHSELVYLQACLQESLRLCPPVPTGGPRQVPSDEGRIICGRYFPPGTQIYVPAYPLQRDPRYFDQPNDFIPERWIGYPTSSSLAISWNHSAAAPLTLGTPTASPTSLIGTTSIPVPRPSSPYTAYTPSPFTNARIIKDPLAYIPFSYGPANCVGKMLAKREILMVIPTLMRRFELEFADKDGAWRDQWVNDLPDHFITTKIPLLMRLVLRDGKREASLPP
ncbi:cytochrome P450 [Pterulicium gracile]|uniref:Cytochrome P450 n=1 Tax=Pterulicium gracile TaxID=1884261 RepID=A0A5C3QEN9_9AGAR|nr:cytochrome P450 [Pterula gracilis]